MCVRSSSSTSANNTDDGALGATIDGLLAAGLAGAAGFSTVVGFGATAGSVVPPGWERRVSGLAGGAAFGEGVGLCGEDLGGGAFGAAGAGALGTLGVNAGFGATGRGPVAAGTFFTSGRCTGKGERVDAGALAALGALFGAGSGREADAAEGGMLGSTSSGRASAGASLGAGGGSLPGSASPIPGTLETWIT